MVRVVSFIRYRAGAVIMKTIGEIAVAWIAFVVFIVWVWSRMVKRLKK